MSFAQLARFPDFRFNEANRRVGVVRILKPDITMNVNDLIGPAVVAAIVSGFVTILGNVFRIALRAA